ncbi:MAG: ATPase domain-containing protein [Candidatus Diapherotrites archaeon]
MAFDLKKLENLPGQFIVLLVVKNEENANLNTDLLKNFVRKDGTLTIYLTVNRPCHNLMEYLKSQGIDTKNFFILDAISEEVTGPMASTERCIYIESPKDLTSLSIGIVTAFKKTEGQERFLFLDSLSTLMIYNDPNVVKKFIHFLTAKMRMFGVKGAMITLRKESDEKLISDFSPFVDKVIEV